MTTNTKVSETLFRKYEHLAKRYANLLFNQSRLGYEKEDLVQEFRIKLYEVILAYGKSCIRYEETGRKKPVPLKYYIRAALARYKQDFIKKIESEKSKTFESFSNVESFDYAKHSDSIVEVDFLKSRLFVNGFNLLYGLDGRQQCAFMLWIKGYEIEKLKKIFDKFFDVKILIRNQKKLIQQFKQEFQSDNTSEFFVKQFVTDDM